MLLSKSLQFRLFWSFRIDFGDLVRAGDMFY